MGKNYDEFAAHRSASNSAFTQLATNTKLPSAGVSSSGSKSSANVFQSLAANYHRANYVTLSTSPNGSGGSANVGSGNSIQAVTTELCNQAEEACRTSLYAAVAQARTLNAPAPLDVVTGFESGCHLDRESNVMLLIGRAGVHAIAHQTVDEMFNWAETLEKNLIG